MYNYFSLRRFLLVLRNEVLSDYRSWLIYLITIVGVYTGISLIEGAVFRFSGNMAEPNNLNYLFPGFLFLGGYIATSLSFSDVNDKFKNNLWLTLPGSTLEKYGVGVLVSGIGYVIFLIAAFIIASVISNVFTRPIFGMGLAIFNPFTLDFGGFAPSVWHLAFIYLLTHSIFLVGSIVFKNAAFIKTVLVAFAVQLALSIIFSLIGYILVKAGLSMNWDINALIDFNFTPGNLAAIATRTSVITGVILSIFFNVVAYLKLTEKEVKGGV